MPAVAALWNSERACELLNARDSTRLIFHRNCIELALTKKATNKPLFTISHGRGETTTDESTNQLFTDTQLAFMILLKIENTKIKTFILKLIFRI